MVIYIFSFNYRIDIKYHTSTVSTSITLLSLFCNWGKCKENLAINSSSFFVAFSPCYRLLEFVATFSSIHKILLLTTTILRAVTLSKFPLLLSCNFNIVGWVLYCQRVELTSPCCLSLDLLLFLCCMQIRKEALWACFAMEPDFEAMISVSWYNDITLIVILEFMSIY